MEQLDTITVIVDSIEEPAVTSVDDSSAVDQIEDEPEDVEVLLNDPGETAAEVTGDTLILTQLEIIDAHISAVTDAVDSVNDNIVVNTQAVDTLNENIASFAVDFNKYAASRDEKDLYIIGYLHIFLIMLFTVLGFIFIYHLAKWIENTICDR